MCAMNGSAGDKPQINRRATEARPIAAPAETNPHCVREFHQQIKFAQSRAGCREAFVLRET